MVSRLIALLLLVWPVAATIADAPGRVLLVQSFRSAIPVNRAFAAGIVAGLDLPVELETETIDTGRIHDEEYLRKLAEIYRLKYQANAPDVIIATYTFAARFLVQHRDTLFPGVPLVFCAAGFSSEELERIGPGVTGVTSKADYAGTLELMSRLHPDMLQVELIVGSSYLDESSELVVRDALEPYRSRFEFNWLRGLPLDELTAAVRALPAHTVILYIAQFGDREGALYVPRDVARAVADSASVPVYGLWDTLIGAGVVGGRMIAIEQQGVVAGRMARRILMGETPDTIPVVRMDRNDAVLDARQLTRWQIDNRRLPEDSRVLYRSPSVWAAYRDAVLLVGGVIVLLALWIVVLNLSRRRLQRTQVALQSEYGQRIRAEEVARRLRARLGAAEKQSTLGALAGGIAHEVGQPLISIKNYAQAAARYVPADAEHAGKLTELLANMEGEAHRAGTIIQKVRKLLGSGHVDAIPVDLDPVIREVLEIMRPEADACGCQFGYRIEKRIPRVLADALEIQLVLVNLLRNAMEAAAVPVRDGDRSISVEVRRAAETAEVEVSVADRGPGVCAQDAETIFDSMYSTKSTGMGVGLAMCRAIVEAHDGRIWCVPNAPVGAIFRFTLPAAEPVA